jgi:hypothetical protein
MTGEPVKYVARRNPADSFVVRVVTSLLLIRLGASALRWAIQRSFL